MIEGLNHAVNFGIEFFDSRKCQYPVGVGSETSYWKRGSGKVNETVHDYDQGQESG